VARRIDRLGVIEAPAEAMGLHGLPETVRCSACPDQSSARGFVRPVGPWERKTARASDKV
jgi:hypothetical protein